KSEDNTSDDEGKGDDEVLFVRSIHKTEHRIYDKRQSCYFCNKMVAKIARHLESSHNTVSEVAEALSFTKGSKERKKELERLRLKGNYYHNIKVLETKQGEIIPYRRSKLKMKATDFIPCPSCLGFFKKDELWKHDKTCSFKNEKLQEDEEGQKFKKIQEQSRILLLSQLEPRETKAMIQIKVTMKQDEISLVAKTDPLIVKYGEVLLERVGASRSREVSQGMRELARLLLELQKNSPNDECSLRGYFKPVAFDAVVCAVNSLCIGIPSLALRLGHSIKKCIYVLKGQALRNKDTSIVEEVGYFEQLMTNEWNNKVSYHSLAELSNRSRNKINLLPLTNDLTLLRKHLLSQINILAKSLKANPSLNLWQKLEEYLICRLIIFNKRRGGEASKMLVKEYQSRPNWKTAQTAAITDALQPLEKKLSER
ncbi:hypothetical protein QZH41_011480, partial [Actinostola sp. cb2023]